MIRTGDDPELHDLWSSDDGGASFQRHEIGTAWRFDYAFESQGRIWVLGKGPAELGDGEPTPHPGWAALDEPRPVDMLFLDQRDRLFAATRSGQVYVADPSDQTFELIHNPFRDVRGRTWGGFHRITQGPGGTIWAANRESDGYQPKASHGVFRLDEASRSWQHAAPGFTWPDGSYYRAFLDEHDRWGEHCPATGPEPTKGCLRPPVTALLATDDYLYAGSIDAVFRLRLPDPSDPPR